MAYVVAALSLWLALVAVTALRPRRRGALAALSYPIGWIAGELPIQAVTVELGLLGLLAWWGWPIGWIDPVVVALALVVVATNGALLVASFRARRVVAESMRDATPPLIVGGPGEDVFGRWWRTALQLPLHPRDLVVTANVPYGPEPRHRLDVWRTREDLEGAPVIFYIHGGAWTFGDKREQGRPMLHEFCARGWVAVAANYRLAPRHPWPAQIEDVTRTLAWIKREISAYGGDPDRVVVAGGSAGGHLAALLALSGDDPTWRPSDVADVDDWSVRGCLSFYGVLEMTGDEAHWRGLGRGLRRLLEHRVVQVPFEGNEALYRHLSPYHRLDAAAPPFFVVQGVTDTLVDVQVARDFVDRARRVSLQPVYYVELPLTQHAFDVTASPRTSATTRAAIAFAEATTTPRPRFSTGLLDVYRVPPAQLEVAADGGHLDAVAYAARGGPYYVVTSDNPGSVVRSPERNEVDRAELAALLVSRGAEAVATRARDATGRFPDEVGWVVTERALALGLARRYAQLALYRVDATGVSVLEASSGRER